MSVKQRQLGQGMTEYIYLPKRGVNKGFRACRQLDV